MLAVLPKRNLDEISGELFVAAYVKKLSGYPNEKISFMAETALDRCKWFPTIAECIEIAKEWRRRDVHVDRKRMAEDIFRKESSARDNDRKNDEIRQRLINADQKLRLTVWQIRELPKEIMEAGLASGILTKTDDGIICDHRDAEEYRPKNVMSEPTCKKCHDLGEIMDMEGNILNCPECEKS